MQVDKDQQAHMGYCLRREDDVLYGASLRPHLHLRKAGSMSITAMKQALDALESSRIFVTTREKTKHPEGTEWYDDAITALRQAIEQAESHEPIGSVTSSPWRGLENIEWQQQRDIPEGTHMLYLHPPTAPAQGLFTDMIQQHEGLAEELAAPAQPLTEQVIRAIAQDVKSKQPAYYDQAFARAIEAAHGIKGASL